MLTIRLKFLLLTVPILLAAAVLASIGALESTAGLLGACIAFAGYAFVMSGQVAQSDRAMIRAVQRLVPDLLPARAAQQPAKAVAALQTAADELDSCRDRIRALEADLATARAAAERADAAKRAFLANVGHEFRTPMNVIIGMTRLSMRTEQTTQQRDYLERVDRAAHTLLNQLNNVLDFVKLDAGGLRIDQVAFNLDDVLETVAGLARLKGGGKAIDIRMQRDPDVPATLVGDPQRLSQVLVNLSENAVKFTDRGEVRISCRLDHIADGQALVSFEVRDTGIGIEPEHLSDLLLPFAQGDNSMTRRYGGSGLGLSICYRLVDVMGGRLHLQSAPGQGSAMSFTVPLRVPDANLRNYDGARAPVPAERRRAPLPAPQLDLTGTRLRLHGDFRALRRLLIRFKHDHCDFVADYRDLSSAGDRHGASQLAGALARAAGTLGAVELKEAAERLTMKRRADDDPGDDLYLVSRLLFGLLAEIAEKLNIAEPIEHELMGRLDSAERARAELITLLRDLGRLLDDFDAASINHFRAVRRALSGLVAPTTVDELQQAINSFDFALAQAHLQAIADELSIPLTQTS
jgi:signal transduction histidine kinase/HPt (histidine-containing phosphotransfer) domain-containing protein